MTISFIAVSCVNGIRASFSARSWTRTSSASSGSDALISPASTASLLLIHSPVSAERGFDGTSIATIAQELGLTKQALLHHFGSKEKLYGEVLPQISEGVIAELNELAESSEDPHKALETLLIEHIAGRLDQSGSTRILMPELLGNRYRAEPVRTWYLKPYVDRLIVMVKAIPAAAHFSNAQALAAVYPLLGAVNCLVISGPTLSGMYGKRRFDAMKLAYPETLRAMVRAGFRDGSSDESAKTKAATWRKGSSVPGRQLLRTAAVVLPGKKRRPATRCVAGRRLSPPARRQRMADHMEPLPDLRVLR